MKEAKLGRWYATNKSYGTLWTPDSTGIWSHHIVDGNYSDFIMILTRSKDKVTIIHCNIPWDIKDPKIMPCPLPWLKGPSSDVTINKGYYDTWFSERSNPLLMPLSFRLPKRITSFNMRKAIRAIYETR